MDFTGVIKFIGETQSGTSKAGKAWQKVEFIVEEVGEQYPNSLCFTAMNERISELTDFKVGTPVTVTYNAKAHEYNGKVFNSLSLFRLQLNAAPQSTAAPGQPWGQQQQPQQQQPWQQAYSNSPI